MDVVKYLLQHKATVNALRSKSATSLVCAARKGQSHLQILQMLLAAKADPNISEPVNGFRMPGSPNEVLKERLPLQVRVAFDFKIDFDVWHFPTHRHQVFVMLVMHVASAGIPRP